MLPLHGALPPRHGDLIHQASSIVGFKGVHRAGRVTYIGRKFGAHKHGHSSDSGQRLHEASLKMHDPLFSPRSREG